MSFNFYFAGTQCQETTDLIRNLNGNVLKSYVNDRREILKWFTYKREGWQGKLLIDSGAFSVHRQTVRASSFNERTFIDDYIKWLNDNDDVIDYAIEFDHIPGVWGQPKTAEQIKEAPKISWDNYVYMYTNLKSPKKLLPVFHQGENFKWLENMLDSDMPEYICLSGNKELTNKQREDWYEKCYYLISRKRPDIKVHCLGSATIQNAIKYPFTSMDATSWIMTGANGNILSDLGSIYVGNINDFNVLSKMEQDSIITLLSKYNITIDQVTKDYKYRMLYNIHYLYDKSINTTCLFNNYKKGKLF